ncbi:glucose-6-phosphate isomerase [Spongiibacter sp. IMCC21906]|uniref:glucose-6-phosphate isomerase n=1 Tax=Spongiibacter sp. IMCC21906 TaxID=1620392 RepID=UPI00062E041E|nr:glucose-6-phosphate isomerase [Spongiibacter sp. IMCC21906]AKH68632.1 glucose-6-phosphate isomerase [Spongiibacter sp. IMCC21906]
MTQDDASHALSALPEWQTLTQLADASASTLLKTRFQNDPNRAQCYSGDLGSLFVDYSKHHLDQDILDALLALADSAKLSEKLSAQRSGAAVNNTENRKASYPDLRQWASKTGSDPELANMYDKMPQLVDAVHSGKHTGTTGKAFTDVVNIGIGGSDFGPRLLCDALSNQGSTKLKAHFAANIDPSVISDILAQTPPETTLFLVASKSFGTQETRSNAEAAMAWLRAATGQQDISDHVIAITSKPSAAEAFGIKPSQILSVPEWIGGRFSVWSGFGLAVALYAGMDAFKDFLLGGHDVDQHVENTPLTDNIPVILGLLDVWYRNFWGYTSQAILPYEHRLGLLPTYLQQLFMESAGKSVDVNGNRLGTGTGNVIWGTEGTNGQHSFHQLLHQGGDAIPCDFITALRSYNPIADQHQALVANCFGQSLVLMNGQSAAEAEAELLSQGVPPEEAATLGKHKAMLGNKPSTTITMEMLTPRALGSLIALYEYRLFTASFIWNINPFDQWGVERGKQVSKLLMEGLSNGGAKDVDSSTAQLMQRFAKAQQ